MPLTRLATLLCWGVTALAVQAPPSKPGLPPAPLQQPAPQPVLSDAERVTRLRALVEQAEKALDAEDEDAAAARADEAEVLVADWDQALIQRPDVQILLERLKGVQSQVSEEAPEAAPGQAPEPETGLKEEGQVSVLQGSDLNSEAAKVQAAEQGATYDFPIDLNDKVLTWVRLFTTEKRGYMERTLERGAAYFPMIRQVFAEEGVPQDLAYLGVVESGYLNQAKSYARAVGMWQFMPSTGRLFGLKIDRWRDERRDPVKATHAAARYLRRLYETSGDWYLALVGYNAGPLTTQNAQIRLGSSNFWDMYRSPYLRNQTKNYVPEMCAAVLIARNAESYGFKASSDTPFVYETVQVERATSLSAIAHAAGVTDAEIKELNPQLLRGSTPPGAYEVRVPVGRALEAQRRLAGASPSRHEDSNSYKIRRGDTPAKVAQRFGVDAQDLLDANHLSASTFRPGKRIVIPPPSIESSSPVAEPAKPAIPAKPLEDLPAVPSAPVDPTLAPPSGGAYRARAGDTLAKIARAKGVSFAELVRLNPEGAKRLDVGDAVTLPGATADTPASAPVAVPAFHTVRRGETLSSIAGRYGLSAADLKRWNRLRSGRVRAGQRLRLRPRP